MAELHLPADVDRQVQTWLKSLTVLSKEAAKLPNSERIKVVPIQQRSSPWVLKLAIALGVLAAIGTVASNARSADRESVVHQSDNGILPSDLRTIPDALQWRTVEGQEFEAGFTAWARERDITPESKISLDAFGNGVTFSTAYMLVTDKTPGVKRVVWVGGRQVLYDIVDTIEGIARVPKDNMAAVKWSENGTPVETADGDGLLLLRDHNNPAGATIFFTKDGTLHSGIPADFHSVPVR